MSHMYVYTWTKLGLDHRCSQLTHLFRATRAGAGSFIFTFREPTGCPLVRLARPAREQQAVADGTAVQETKSRMVLPRRQGEHQSQSCQTRPPHACTRLRRSVPAGRVQRDRSVRSSSSPTPDVSGRPIEWSAVKSYGNGKSFRELLFAADGRGSR